MNLIEAIEDPNLFGPWFRDRGSWRAWFAFLQALFALPMDDASRGLFARCTGRSEPPSGPATEAWLVVGRRGGKSFIVALVAVFLACFRSYAEHLAPGERGTVMILAADRKQARVIFRYITALLERVPMLSPLVERRTAETVDLSNRISIEVHTSSFRAVRGYTVVAALCDEIAFWRSDESANPDTEILAALRPAMATIPNGLLLCLSSPYARRGALYEAHRDHYGEDGSVLVWQADTRTMNPTVPQSVIDAAYERDPASAAAEYGARFRSDIESFISREAVDACVVSGRYELPPVGDRQYVAFVDPSGGSQDSMTLAVAHREGDKAVLDAVRERKPPFSPDDVVKEFAALLKSYGLGTVTGDRYAGEWPRERFRQRGVHYKAADRAKSDLYRDLLPVLNSARAELLDNSRLTAQLCRLERRTARSGKDTIDHAPGAHDDLINAAAGALVSAARNSETVGEAWAAPRMLDDPRFTQAIDGSDFVNVPPAAWDLDDV